MIPSDLRRTALGFLALLLAAGAAQQASAQTTLRYKFNKGEKLNYVMEQKVTMSMSVMGQDIDIEMGQTIDMTWNIKDVDSHGKAKLTQKFDRVRFNMNGGPVGKVDYDSKEGKDIEGPLGKILGPMLKALADVELTMSMDAQGKISDVTIPDKIAQAFKKVPGGGAGLGEMFSEDGLKHMMDQSGLILPKDAIAKGSSWDQKMDLKTGMMAMKVEITNTLDAPVKRDGKELERVTMKPKITLETNENSPAQIKLKSQDNKGAAYFDNAAGRLVETNMTQKLEMGVSVAGMDLSQKMNQTVTLKLVPKQ
jgi:uncharacterized protein DUF6263